MTDSRPTSAPTLEMVAAAAGVSRSTVSRVINDSPKVTPEAFAAVQAAIVMGAGAAVSMARITEPPR